MSFPLNAFYKCLAQIVPKVPVTQGLRSLSAGVNLFGKSKGRDPPKDDDGPSDPSNEVLANIKFIPKTKNLIGKHRTCTFGLPILSERDCERRIIFAQQFLDLLDRDPTILDSIVFSDEGNFWPITINGAPKKKNKRFNESEPVPTIVWCGMSSKEIIGPYFFNSYVTESSYLKMLKKYLLPQLTCLNYTLANTWFQQDGAPPHRTERVLAFLENAFEDRLMSHGCPIAWPPRSQDLTPLDYFFWDYLKTRIEPFRPSTTKDLRECIAFEVKVVEPTLLKKKVNEFTLRLEKCVTANGKRFTMDEKNAPTVI